MPVPRKKILEAEIEVQDAEVEKRRKEVLCSACCPLAGAAWGVIDCLGVRPLVFGTDALVRGGSWVG